MQARRPYPSTLTPGPNSGSQSYIPPSEAPGNSWSSSPTSPFYTPEALTLAIKGSDSYSQLSRLYDSQKDTINHIHLGAFLTQIAAPQEQDPQRPRRLTPQSLHRSPRFNCTPKLNTASSGRFRRTPPPLALTLAMELAAQAAARVEQLQPRQVSNIMWAASKLQLSPFHHLPPGWHETLVMALVARMEEANGRDLANTLLALAAASSSSSSSGVHSSGSSSSTQAESRRRQGGGKAVGEGRVGRGRDESGSEPLIVPLQLMTQLLGRSPQLLAQCNAQELSNAIYSLATLQVTPTSRWTEAWLDASAEPGVMQRTSAQSHANNLWALSNLSHAPNLASPAGRRWQTRTLAAVRSLMHPQPESEPSPVEEPLSHAVPTPSTAGSSSSSSHSSSRSSSSLGTDSQSSSDRSSSDQSSSNQSSSSSSLGPSLQDSSAAAAGADAWGTDDDDDDGGGGSGEGPVSASPLASPRPEHLTSILWGLARLEVLPPRAWLEDLLAWVYARRHTLAAWPLTNILTALARINYRPPDKWLNATCTAVLLPDASAAAAAAAADPDPSTPSQPAHSSATPTPATATPVTAALPAPPGSDAGVAGLRAGVPARVVLDTSLDRGPMAMADVVGLLCAFAGLKYQPPPPLLTHLLGNAGRGAVPGCSDQHLVDLVWALATAGYVPEPVLLARIWAVTRARLRLGLSWDPVPQPGPAEGPTATRGSLGGGVPELEPAGEETAAPSGEQRAQLRQGARHGVQLGLSGGQTSKLLWAVAKLQLAPPPLWIEAAVGRVMATLTGLSDVNFLETVFAIGKLGVIPSDEFRNLLAASMARRAPGMRGATLCSLVAALPKLGFNRRLDNSAMMRPLLQQIGTLMKQHTASVAQAAGTGSGVGGGTAVVPGAGVGAAKTEGAAQGGSTIPQLGPTSAGGSSSTAREGNASSSSSVSGLSHLHPSGSSGASSHADVHRSGGGDGGSRLTADRGAAAAARGRVPLTRAAVPASPLSPVDVAKLMSGLVAIGYEPSLLWRGHFLALLEQRGFAEYSPWALAQVLEGLEWMQAELTPPAQVKFLDAAAASFDHFSSKDLEVLLRSRCLLGMSPGQGWWDALYRATLPSGRRSSVDGGGGGGGRGPHWQAGEHRNRGGRLSPPDLVHLLYSLAHPISIPHPPAEWMEAVLAELQPSLPALQPRALARLMVALVRHWHIPGGNWMTDFCTSVSRRWLTCDQPVPPSCRSLANGAAANAGVQSRARLGRAALRRAAGRQGSWKSALQADTNSAMFTKADHARLQQAWLGLSRLKARSVRASARPTSTSPPQHAPSSDSTHATDTATSPQDRRKTSSGCVTAAPLDPAQDSNDDHSSSSSSSSSAGTTNDAPPTPVTTPSASPETGSEHVVGGNSELQEGADSTSSVPTHSTAEGSSCSSRPLSTTDTHPITTTTTTLTSVASPAALSNTLANVQPQQQQQLQQPSPSPQRQQQLQLDKAKPDLPSTRPTSDRTQRQQQQQQQQQSVRSNATSSSPTLPPQAPTLPSKPHTLSRHVNKQATSTAEPPTHAPAEAQQQETPRLLKPISPVFPSPKAAPAVPADDPPSPVSTPLPAQPSPTPRALPAATAPQRPPIPPTALRQQEQQVTAGPTEPPSHPRSPFLHLLKKQKRGAAVAAGTSHPTQAAGGVPDAAPATHERTPVPRRRQRASAPDATVPRQAADGPTLLSPPSLPHGSAVPAAAASNHSPATATATAAATTATHGSASTQTGPTPRPTAAAPPP
ncbi:MAG: hypothetical protein WDW38_009493 [Sanguina aurantia]